MDVIAVIATLAVLSANVVIRKNQNLAFILFIICNICYMIVVGNKVLVVQNLALALINVWNLLMSLKPSIKLSSGNVAKSRLTVLMRGEKNAKMECKEKTKA